MHLIEAKFTVWFQSNLSRIMAWRGLVVGLDITDGGLPGAGDLVQEAWRQGHGPGSPYNWCGQHSAPAPAPLLTDGLSTLRSLQAQE